MVQNAWAVLDEKLLMITMTNASEQHEFELKDGRNEDVWAGQAIVKLLVILIIAFVSV